MLKTKGRRMVFFLAVLFGSLFVGSFIWTLHMGDEFALVGWLAAWIFIIVTVAIVSLGMWWAERGE